MIDVTFDFTTDSGNYWEGFWNRNNGLGYGATDPDNASPTLQEYHRLLWSRKLPNGQVMSLKKGRSSYDYLSWGDFRFGSDSIIVGFRYERYRYIMEQVKESVGDFRTYYEDLIRRSYTIGGMIIFPKHVNSINQSRGRSTILSDRWDLTIECIRRYYSGEDSPIGNVLRADAKFFDLFVDFKGYVDFFFLNDCVSSDYSRVDIWEGDGKLEGDGLPKTLDGYFQFIKQEFEFLAKRNQRIAEYARKNGL